MKELINDTLQYQDQAMKAAFDAYPEILFVDSTYKTNDLRMPLYILVIEDGNGCSIIVDVWLVVQETLETLTQLVNSFKARNDKWSHVRVVMSDKDFTEREAFSTAFPDALLQLCLFHVLRTFRREVTTDKMDITNQQRQDILTCLQDIAYSHSEETYNTNYAKLLTISPPDVANYYNTNWHPIRKQWVFWATCQDGNFLNRTNNRTESMHGKLKSLIQAHSSILGSTTCRLLGG